MIVGNFERALVSFAPQRLVTEGVIFLNAALCMVGIILSAPTKDRELPDAGFWWSRLLPKTVVVGLAAMVSCVLADWGVTRAIFGDRQAPRRRSTSALALMPRRAQRTPNLAGRIRKPGQPCKQEREISPPGHLA